VCREAHVRHPDRKEGDAALFAAFAERGRNAWLLAAVVVAGAIAVAVTFSDDSAGEDDRTPAVGTALGAGGVLATGVGAGLVLGRRDRR
jgi:hypothetical protein